MRLTDRVAVVTGAASGMGRALCCLLGRRGARLILVDRDQAGLESLADELQAAGTRATTAAVDVRDRPGLREAVRSHGHRLGPVDLAIASAGITSATLVDSFDVERLAEITRVNFLGVVNTIDAVVPEMLRRRRGQIVAISSLLARRGMPFGAAYGASKAALSTYLESIRPPLRKRGIVVTTVCPGFVRTPLMEGVPGPPPARMMTSQHAARHVLRAIRLRRPVYCFPRRLAWGTWALGWLPAGLYDRIMARVADAFPDYRY